jgi:pilus assembly protein CpaB
MRRPVMFVVLAGLAAMLASVVVYSALKKRETEVQNAMAKNVNIVVAAYDLPLGTKIEPGELKLTKWSSDSLPDGAYRNPSEVIGSFVKGSFVANEPIVASKLFIGQKTAGVLPLLIPYGMRAVSVPVDEVSDIAGFVLPHTRVDVLVALASGDTGKPFSKVVLQNVEVLAVAQEVEMKKDAPQVVKVVTLLVSPHEAERLALASREGTLRLAMRNYNDNKIVLTSGSDVQRMLSAYSLQPDMPVMKPQETHRVTAPERPRARPFEVEIYRNGKSSESMSFIHEASLGSSEKATPKHHGTFDKVSSSRSSGDEDSNSTASADGSSNFPPATAADANNRKGSTDVRAAANPDAAGSNPHPAGNAVRDASFSAAAPSYAPTPKTIDVP